MDKLNAFVDLFKTNLIIEFNKNDLLKNQLEPIAKAYNTICVGDRFLLTHLNKINYLLDSTTSLPQYYGGFLEPLRPYKPKTTVLPSRYPLSLKNSLRNVFLKLKNIFFNSKASLKFHVEDFVIPNFYDIQIYTEEGLKDLRTFQLEYPKQTLKEIKKIEYLGDNEFIFEAVCTKPLLVKIKIVDDEGVKIDSLSFCDL